MAEIPDKPSEAQAQEETARSGSISNSNMADKSPAPKEEAHAKETGTRPKESYEDYIKALPPPFWATKKPPSYPSTSSTPTTRVQDRSEQEIAASINAVCAPITAADRAEDTRRSSRSLRERWKDWKSDKEKRKSEADIRPMEKGSSARLNVWGSPITDKGRFKK